MSIVFEERRKGDKAVWIDRRVADKSVVERQIQKELYFRNSLVFGSILILIVVLNLFDFIFTLVALSAGAREINPLMAYLFNRNPTELVVFFKIGVVTAAIIALWHFRYFRLTLRLTLLAALFYTCLLVYHLIGLSSIIAAA